jgi:hypothetical protein
MYEPLGLYEIVLFSIDLGTKRKFLYKAVYDNCSVIMILTWNNSLVKASHNIVYSHTKETCILSLIPNFHSSFLFVFSFFVHKYF